MGEPSDRQALDLVTAQHALSDAEAARDAVRADRAALLRECEEARARAQAAANDSAKAQSTALDLAREQVERAAAANVERLQIVRDEHEAAVAHLRDQAEERRSRLAEDLRNAEREVQEARAAAQSAKDRERAAAREHADELSAAAENHEFALDRKEAQRVAAVADAERLRGRVTVAEESLLDVGERARAQQEAAAAAMRDRDAALRDVERLQRLLDVEAGARSAADARASLRADEVTKAAAQLKATTDECDRTARALKAAQDELATEKAKRQSTQTSDDARVRQLQSELQTTSDAMTEMRRKLQAVDDQRLSTLRSRDDADARVAAAAAELKMSQERATALENHVRQLEGDAHRRSEDAKTSATRISQLEAAARDTARAHDALASRCRTASTDAESATSALARARSAHEEDMRREGAALTRLRGEHERAEGEMRKLRESLDDRDSKITTLDGRLATAHNDLEEARRKLADAQQVASEAHAERRKMQATMDGMCAADAARVHELGLLESQLKRRIEATARQEQLALEARGAAEARALEAKTGMEIAQVLRRGVDGALDTAHTMQSGLVSTAQSISRSQHQTAAALTGAVEDALERVAELGDGLSDTARRLDRTMRSNARQIGRLAALLRDTMESLQGVAPRDAIAPAAAMGRSLIADAAHSLGHASSPMSCVQQIAAAATAVNVEGRARSEAGINTPQEAIVVQQRASSVRGLAVELRERVNAGAAAGRLSVEEASAVSLEIEQLEKDIDDPQFAGGLCTQQQHVQAAEALQMQPVPKARQDMSALDDSQNYSGSPVAVAVESAIQRATSEVPTRAASSAGGRPGLAERAERHYVEFQRGLDDNTDRVSIAAAAAPVARDKVEQACAALNNGDLQGAASATCEAFVATDLEGRAKRVVLDNGALPLEHLCFVQQRVPVLVALAREVLVRMQQQMVCGPTVAGDLEEIACDVRPPSFAGGVLTKDFLARTASMVQRARESSPEPARPQQLDVSMRYSASACAVSHLRAHVEKAAAPLPCSPGGRDSSVAPLALMSGDNAPLIASF